MFKSVIIIGPLKVKYIMEAVQGGLLIKGQSVHKLLSSVYKVFIFGTLSLNKSKSVPNIYFTPKTMARFRFNFARQMRFSLVRGFFCNDVNTLTVETKTNSDCFGSEIEMVQWSVFGFFVYK